jgi:hypothetical protein
VEAHCELVKPKGQELSIMTCYELPMLLLLLLLLLAAAESVAVNCRAVKRRVIVGEDGTMWRMQVGSLEFGFIAHRLSCTAVAPTQCCCHSHYLVIQAPLAYSSCFRRTFVLSRLFAAISVVRQLYFSPTLSLHSLCCKLLLGCYCVCANQ